MAYVQHKTSRRHFIRVIAGGAGAVTTMGFMSSFAPGKHETIKVALFSDTHISKDKEDHPNDFYPYNNLQKVVEEVMRSDAEIAVITGDLARMEGIVADYNNLKELIDPLSAKMPVAFAMGNHDRHKPFFEVFTKTEGERQDIDNRFVNVVEYPNMRFVILDSLDKCPSHGFLGKAQRDWLRSYLNEHCDKPVILFVHHSFKDYDGELIDSDRLFDIIKGQKQVKAIIYGHSHSYNFSVRNKIHMINLPSTAYNFRPSEPLGWVETEFSDRGGSFKLHAIAGNTAKDGEVTELKWR